MDEVISGMIFLIKVAFIAVLIAVAIFLSRKKVNLESKRVRFIIVILVVMVSSFVLSFNVDYYLRFFDTPEDAFMFNHTNEVIVDISELEQCAYIISTERPSHTKVSLSLIEKSDKGWRIERSESNKDYKHYIIDNGAVYLYSHSKSMSGFALILQFIGAENSEDIVWAVTDSNNAIFNSYDVYYDDVAVSLRVYYSVIEKLESDYAVYIDGEIQSLND